MNFEQVKYYDLKGILDESFISFVHEELGSSSFKSKLNFILKMLAIYKDVTNESTVKGLNLDLLFIDNNKVDKFYKGFLGFIYCFLSSTIKIKYNYQQIITKIFEVSTSKKSINFTKIICSPLVITDDIEKCISVFKKENINEWKENFYKGWSIKLSNQIVITLDLGSIYLTYGNEYCNKVYKMIQSYESKNINEKSIYRKTRIISHFYNCVTKIYKNLESLKDAFNSINSNDTLIKIHNLFLLEHMQKENDLKGFDSYRKALIAIYQEHVLHELFEIPDFEIFLPKITKQVMVPKTNLKLNAVKAQIEDNKLITVVPLALTDEEAKDHLLKDIINDINHIVHCCETYRKEVINEYRNFLAKGKIGQIKQPKTEKNFWIENPVKVGLDNLNNVFATYQHHPFVHPIVSNYRNFLKMDDDNNSIFFVNYARIYCYLILLINEHPQITESALCNTKVYEDGKFTGIQHIGNDAFITLYKNRRGKLLAEQKITLNARSLELYKELIEITSFARSYLKSINDPNYEYLILINTTPFTLPKRPKVFVNPSTYDTRKYFNDCFIKESCNEDGSPLYSVDQAEKILERITLTKFRASCGVRVYIETLSSLAMSKALGHKEYSKKLIETYLPAPIYNFFSERWIRIFQNAFIFEVMQESEFLFDAIDIKPEDLKKFLKNHKLENIPNFMQGHKNFVTSERTEPMSQAIIPISIGLLQWLIGLKNYVESIKHCNVVSELAQTWYECATFILMQINLSLEDKNSNLILDNRIFEMYSQAKNHPLPLKIIQMALV